jgi:hypothetical protein
MDISAKLRRTRPSKRGAFSDVKNLGKNGVLRRPTIWILSAVVCVFACVRLKAKTATKGKFVPVARLIASGTSTPHSANLWSAGRCR